eukprot:CAMPEP_0202979676 /NCGR_PEP_ID=MMETSP1396-20130829/85766_1 /ASSEMBLY_ACC=CAM_ASM_000872 /TAXON_ID= /ORGANISM="Pseudokeronopsis sp., Strain Brazil" /LENGTH=189 /DNA_ID=CAMNT_0049719219 /DNA_START=669 /DNA_END=1240 /DNA_ORIENTATION=-
MRKKEEERSWRMKQLGKREKLKKRRNGVEGRRRRKGVKERRQSWSEGSVIGGGEGAKKERKGGREEAEERRSIAELRLELVRVVWVREGHAWRRSIAELRLELSELFGYVKGMHEQHRKSILGGSKGSLEKLQEFYAQEKHYLFSKEQEERENQNLNPHGRNIYTEVEASYMQSLMKKKSKTFESVEAL